MRPATLLASISLLGLLVLVFFHLDQRERLIGAEADNWALRERIDGIAHQLDQLRPLTALLSRATRPAPPDPYSAKQVVGPPDVVDGPGDSPLAWCPPEQDAGRPWLLVSFPPGAEVAGVEVHANWNPGAVAEVAAVLPDGSTRIVWKGPQETQTPVSQLRFFTPVTAQQFKLTLDPSAVPGWNEIDAVRALRSEGDSEWAIAAEASASWNEAPAAR